MKKRTHNYLPFFITFFLLSLILILLGTSGLFSNFTSFANSSAQVSKNAIYVLNLTGLKNEEIKRLTKENLALTKRLEDEYRFITDNVAYKSQFQESNEKSPELLPARVIGYPSFIPGVNLPEYLMIDQGEKDEVEVGDTIISNNYLVGKVEKTYPDFSKVILITNKDSSFTAKIGEGSEDNGIITGHGNGELVLENVLLTTNLEKGKNILTKGDRDEEGLGYSPDILVGKITSIEKSQSDLFQKASVESPIDFKNLEIVFVQK